MSIWNKKWLIPAFHCPWLWDIIYAFTESERRIPNGCGSCGNTSGADLEMAVCDLSWPYSVRAARASQATVCVSCLFKSCLRFSPLCSHKLLLLLEDAASPLTTSIILHITKHPPLSVSFCVCKTGGRATMTGGGWHMHTVNCPDHFVTHHLCLQHIAVTVIVL